MKTCQLSDSTFLQLWGGRGTPFSTLPQANLLKRALASIPHTGQILKSSVSSDLVAWVLDIQTFLGSLYLE